MEESRIIGEFLRKLRSNLEDWRSGEIDYPTYSDNLNDTWARIAKHGPEIERRLVTALQHLTTDAERKMLMPSRTARPNGCKPKALSGRVFRIEAQREPHGDHTVHVASVHPTTQRGLAAFIYELAADIEYRSEAKGATWLVYPDAGNARVVIGPRSREDAELADQFVADLVAAHQHH